MGRLIDIDVLFDYFGNDAIDEITRSNIEYFASEKGTVEAIPKADYEARLKADMVAMLTDIQLEIKELWDNRYDVWLDNQYYIGKSDTLEEVDEVIQQKIDAMKEIQNENKNARFI